VTADQRRAALAGASLYLICDIAQLPRAPLESIDILQLREKQAWPRKLLVAARAAAARCAEHGVLFVVNDDPRLALAAGADGVHVGQTDMPPAAARAIVGDDLLIGLSTHTPEEIDAAAGADYIGVGPVHATPTKPGRAAVGLELVRYAAEHATVPWFAIGGVAPDTIDAVVAAGATRVAVVRALTEAGDPEAVARELRVSLGGRVGAT
jgi:thiamine-phosphate pyrophosphorylase